MEMKLHISFKNSSRYKYDHSYIVYCPAELIGSVTYQPRKNEVEFIQL